MIRSQSYCFLGIITIFFFFCLLPLPNTFASPKRSLCRREQRDALLELQKEFHVTTSLWNKSVDCCSWDGVKCDVIFGEVISLKLSSLTTNTTTLKSSSGLFKLHHLCELDLSYCNLQGEIPFEIGNLSHLTSLDLSGNRLVGEVPSSIGKISHLTHLDLSHNHLLGDVPTSVGNLNQLDYMGLSHNDLRGSIPNSFANLSKLLVLDLSNNNFTGGDIVIANLTSLTSIYLSNNHFKSSFFPYLSRLHNLIRFYGNENSFVGPFPSSLLMVSSLERVDLSHNQLEGPIDYGNASSSSKLGTLDLSNNTFDGLISESISKLVNLERLDLSHNNFVGRVPRSMSKLVNLSSVDLSYNKLEGQVPHFLWRLSKLYFVYLSYNSFSSFEKSVEVVDGASFISWLDLGSNSLQGQFPQWIRNLSFLLVLDLSNNHFTGSIPQWLNSSTNLQQLNLRNNSFTGFLPDLFNNGSPLRSLDVSHNNLVGKLPKSLINCKYMEFLNVRENKIKDTFPFWLGSLQNLTVLVLRSNAFYGPVYKPSAYLGFPSLRIIDISNNNFVGSLPQDYFANWHEMSKVWRPAAYDIREVSVHDNYMSSIFSAYESINLVYKGVDTDFVRIYQGFKAIDFSGNKFYGHIPKSIGLLSELRLLNLSGNTFSGNIPPSLANITNLETLDLSQNNLLGEIPQGLGKLSFLSIIDFSYNHLQGLVPRSTQFRTQNCSSFVGNTGLYGLEDICGESHHLPVPTTQQLEESLSEAEEPVLNWIAAAITFGPGVFCGLVIGHIFTSYKHKWFTAR